jgi:hypothetical protein
MPNATPPFSLKKYRRIFIFLFPGIFLFYGCVSYKLHYNVNVKIAWSDSLVTQDSSSSWGFSNEEMFKKLNAQFKQAFTEGGQLTVVRSDPDYIFRVDSVYAYARAENKRYEDPCQKQQGLLSLIIFGDNTTYSTFIVHSMGLIVYAKLIDAHFKSEIAIAPSGLSTEYVTQKSSSDSVNCNPYILAGNASEEKVMSNLCSSVRYETKYQVRKWQKGKK